MPTRPRAREISGATAAPSIGLSSRAASSTIARVVGPSRRMPTIVAQMWVSQNARMPSTTYKLTRATATSAPFWAASSTVTSIEP